MNYENHRTARSAESLPRGLGSCLLFLLLGGGLGVFSKWMDTLACGDGNVWAGLLLKLSLPQLFSEMSIWALLALLITVHSRSAGKAAGNVFSFFLGMMVGYYLYTVLVLGFVPRAVILAWGVFTLLTPLGAILAWNAKGSCLTAVVISALILGFFLSQTFAVGFWYFDLIRWQNLLMTALAVLLLWGGRKKCFWSLLGGFLLLPFVQWLLPYVVGGL